MSGWIGKRDETGYDEVRKNFHLYNFSVISDRVASLVAVQPSSAYAAEVGVVDYQEVLNRYPDMQKANAAFQAAVDQAKKEFDAKSQGMSDKDKQDLGVKLSQQIEQERREILGPILDKINAAVKAVADSKRLSVVVGKGAVVTGGVDITNDVIAKVAGG